MALADQVRSLIGDAHWLSDGHHKELLLGDVLRRHLPPHIQARRGFVLGAQGTPHECSTEQDILLVDTSRGLPMLSTPDLVVAYPQQVVAAISVKTKLRKSELTDAIRGLQSVGNTLVAAGVDQDVWGGVFFYECSNARRRHARTTLANIKAAVQDTGPVAAPKSYQQSRPLLMHCLGVLAGPFFQTRRQPAGDITSMKIHCYDAGPDAAALFVASLLRHISAPHGSYFASALDRALPRLKKLSPGKALLDMNDIAC